MNKNRLPRIVWLLAAGIMAFSCTREAGNDPEPNTPVDLTVDTRAIPPGHACQLYIFKGNALLQSVSLPSGKATLTMNQSDLVAANNFRFLYVSQPSGISNGVEVKDSGTNLAPVPGNTWANLRIEAKSQELSGLIYYKIDTYTGIHLAGNTSLTATLQRLVGQQVIDIFKVGASGQLADTLSTSANVASVLDRVSRIDLTYTGLTRVISFSPTNAIVEGTTWGTLVKTLPVSYNTTAGTDLLKVTLPQDSIKLLQIGSKTLGGAAHIMGVWGLPSTGRVTIQAKFTYRHTTPTLCGAPNPAVHLHDEGCFPLKSKNPGEEPGDPNLALFLNLPKTGGINMVSNKYTVTKAGIKYDRVIDVGVSGGFGFLTDWANGNVGP